VGTVKAVINTNFGEGAPGEIVEVDEDLWADYIEGGFLSVVNEQGERVEPVVPREGFPLPDPEQGERA
jgi:hypothetical protein